MWILILLKDCMSSLTMINESASTEIYTKQNYGLEVRQKDRKDMGLLQAPVQKDSENTVYGFKIKLKPRIGF